MNDSAPAPASPPAPSPWWLRGLRTLVILLLGLTLTGLMVLAAAGYLPAIVFRLMSGGSLDATGKILVRVLVVALALVPGILLAWANRRGALTWRNLGVLAIPVAVVLGWLAHDEPVLKYPLTVADIAPEFPGADRSYAVLMRYSKHAPSEEAKAFNKRQWTVTSTGWPGIKEARRKLELVVEKRAALEADWATLAPERRWIGELNAFERIGDLTPSRWDADIMSFGVWRIFSQQACAMALLQAVDGQGDEAVATLLPLLECGRKLQRDSRTLVRSMIGTVMERMALETAGIVLERTAVSPAQRSRLAAAVAGDNPAAEARRLVLIEYAVFTPAILREARAGKVEFFLDDRWGWARDPLKRLGAVLVNPTATANLMGRNAFELAAMAEAREIAKIDARGWEIADSLERDPGMKNLGGRLVMVISTPAYARIVESCWNTADLRAGLRQRLAPAVATN